MIQIKLKIEKTENIAELIGHTQVKAQNLCKIKRKYPFEYFLFWCANRDSNPNKNGLNTDVSVLMTKH